MCQGFSAAEPRLVYELNSTKGNEDWIVSKQRVYPKQVGVDSLIKGPSTSDDEIVRVVSLPPQE